MTAYNQCQSVYKKGGDYMIPVDLFSLIIGMVLGAVIYWLATHTDIWIDKSFEDEKKAASHGNEKQQWKTFIRGNFTTETKELI